MSRNPEIMGGYPHMAFYRLMTTISPQDVIQTYDRYAPIYDRFFGAVLEPGRKRLAAAVARLQPETLLEVGVGSGLTLFQYPEKTRVVGVDISEGMLEHARRRADAMPERDITLRAMNAEAMDFPDASFDCVTVPYVLSVTPEPARLVAELRRVCRPGGTIMILNHFSGSRFWWLLERAVRSIAARIGFRSDFDYAEQILAHDWTVESVEPVNLMGLSKLVIIRN
ncbi:class I SAM-dependent methyltransferase [Coralloluteibacterium thermophilus]|uniref:Class I SAM-dependent methyltransferase n=1 Tax=Coralloluteibacterium thermophilum TaxID=2707049 RepID=A0ABV9NQH3_9GAMM